MRTHYDNLKVLRNAPPEVIRAAYKVLCQKYHPDKFPGNSQSAERVMKILNAAYSVLSDAEKKEAYNKFLAEVEVQAKQDKARESAWQNHKPQPDAQQESHRHDDDAEAKPRYKPYASGWQTPHESSWSEPQPLSKSQLALRRFFARSLDYSCGNLVVIGILGLVALVGLLGWLGLLVARLVGSPVGRMDRCLHK
jgi:curved DNA-binding protein CbpA